MITATTRVPALGRAGWALYEGGRTPYFVLVNIYVFAPYFSSVVIGDPVKGQATWGAITAVSALFVAILGPLVGAIADAGGRRKPLLGAITLIALPAMTALWFTVPGGSIWPSVAALMVAGLCFEFSTILHNAMLPAVARPGQIGKLSGLGLGAGNLGSILLLILYIVGFAIPAHPWLGLSHAAHQPERAIGILAALWFALFALPLFLATPDSLGTGLGPVQAVRHGLATLRQTLSHLGRYRNIARFIVARMVFNDGFVVILYFSGIYVGGLFGWSTAALTAYGIAMTAVAALSAVVAGRIDDRIGSKRALLMAIGGVFVTEIVALSIDSGHVLWLAVAPRAAGAPAWSSLAERLFIADAALITFFILQGLVSARAMLARIAPPSMLGEFYGLFALSGNAMAFLAPLAVSIATAWSGSQRAGFAVVLAFLGVGGAILIGVREEQPT